MEDSSKTSVSFECRSIAEAERIRYAVSLHRHALKQRGIDLRNYAPAEPGFAGFGWDTVVRAAQDMGNGTVTHMSYRIAQALKEALESLAERTPDYDQHKMAKWSAGRLAALLPDGGAS